MSSVEARYINHQPRRLDHCHMRLLEFEREILSGPLDQAQVIARCPDCDCVMMYRGVGRLRNGTLVHYFECVHSHQEVHSVSIVIAE